jgi:hypothetical protein
MTFTIAGLLCHLRAVQHDQDARRREEVAEPHDGLAGNPSMRQVQRKEDGTGHREQARVPDWIERERRPMRIDIGDRSQIERRRHADARELRERGGDEYDPSQDDVHADE